MFPVLIFKSQIFLAFFAFSCGWFGCGYAALCNLWFKSILYFLNPCKV